METTFKETKIGRIPNDWQVQELAGCLNITNGFPAESEYFTKDDVGIPLIRIRDISGQFTEVQYVGDYPQGCVVKKGDLLVAMDGEFVAAQWKGDNALLNQRVCRLETKSPGILNQAYLFYNINIHLRKIEQSTGATTVKHLSAKDINRIRIALPPLAEQRKIAEILSTVDETIEGTDAIIQKTQQLKKGLMQKLFTDGIGHTRFKETEIGRIPEEWEVMRVRDIATLSTSGVAYEDYEKGKVPEGTKVIYLKVSDLNLQGNEKRIKSGMIEGFFDDGFMRNAHVIQPPSLIFPKRGAAISTNKKRIAGVHVVLDPNLMALTTGEKAPAKVAYLYYYFLTVDLSQIQDSGTVPQLNKRNIEPLLVPVPSSQEQFRIVEILSEVDAKIETEQALKAELEQLKKRLMQVLLTGKVRVKV